MTTFKILGFVGRLIWYCCFGCGGQKEHGLGTTSDIFNDLSLELIARCCKALILMCTVHECTSRAELYPGTWHTDTLTVLLYIHLPSSIFHVCWRREQEDKRGRKRGNSPNAGFEHAGHSSRWRLLPWNNQTDFFPDGLWSGLTRLGFRSLPVRLLLLREVASTDSALSLYAAVVNIDI